MISIAMTSYNGRKYIMQQLDSLLNQTLLADEVLIVDDASSDGTPEIIKEFIFNNKLSSWKLISHKNNLGYIKTFREAISKVNGDYIFLCDQDDIWIENKIEIIKKYFDNNSDIKVLASSFNKINDKNELINTRVKPFSSNNNLIRKYISKNTISKITINEEATYNISPGCTCAFVKDVKQAFLLIETEVPHDWTINLIGALLDGLYFLNIETIHYRIHQDNTIGMTRHFDTDIRRKYCISGINERKAMLKLISELTSRKVIIFQGNQFKNTVNYISSLIKLFEKRVVFLDTRRLFPTSLNLIRLSIFKHGILDTIIVDIISVIKPKNKARK